MLNPLSPTFREEQILEKEEEKTEAQNAKDLVCHFTCGMCLRANRIIDGKIPSACSEDGLAWCQLFLLLDCPGHVINNFNDLQCNQVVAD